MFFKNSFCWGGGGGRHRSATGQMPDFDVPHTHTTLSLSHLLAYIFKGHDGLRLEREMLCNMIGGGGGGSGDLENITESLMAAGGQGKGPRFETKRRAWILANEEKDLYLLFSVEERIDLETLVLLNITIPLCSCREHPAFFIYILILFLI